MKKLFLFLLISIFLMSLVSAWSYDNTYSYGDATAYAKVVGMYPACEGNVHGSYCAGTWYADVSHKGDKFYIAYKASGWPSASSSGYSGQGVQLISDGRIYLDENGNVPKYILCAWDYDQAPNGDWAWTGKCGGYLGAEYLDGKKNVGCYDKSDCVSGEICDKSGSWETWVCVQVCPSTLNFDRNRDYQLGADYVTQECPDDPDRIYSYYIDRPFNDLILTQNDIDFLFCSTGEEKCIGTSYYKCENNAWVNKSEVVGKCGVECLEGDIKQHTCPDGTKVDWCVCLNGKFDCIISPENQCPEEKECTIASDCEGKTHIAVPGSWSCEDEKCVWIPSEEKIPIVLLILGIVATVGGLIWLFIWLKKR